MTVRRGRVRRVVTPGPVARSVLRHLTPVLLGLGLVLMHHTVGVPPELTPPAAPTVASSGPHAGHDTRTHDTGVPAEEPHGDHSSMLLHLCLAVLAAAVTALVAVVAHRRSPAGDDPAPVERGSIVVLPVPRPPPLPERLARLQVLRR